MAGGVYQKLLIYRSIEERLRGEFFYYYLRLLDIARFTSTFEFAGDDGKHKAMFQSTVVQMQGFQNDKEIEEASRDARRIVTIMGTRISNGLRNFGTDQPIKAYLVRFLDGARQKARTFFACLMGTG